MPYEMWPYDKQPLFRGLNVNWLGNSVAKTSPLREKCYFAFEKKVIESYQQSYSFRYSQATIPWVEFIEKLSSNDA